MPGVAFPVGRREALRAPGMFGSAERGPDSWFPWQWHSCNSLGLLPGQMTTMTASQTVSSCACRRRREDTEWGQLPYLLSDHWCPPWRLYPGGQPLLPGQPQQGC